MSEQQFADYMRAAGAVMFTVFMVIISIWAIVLTYVSLSEERKGSK